MISANMYNSNLAAYDQDFINLLFQIASHNQFFTGHQLPDHATQKDIRLHAIQLIALTLPLFSSHLLLSSSANRLATNLLDFLRAHRDHLTGQELLQVLHALRFTELRIAGNDSEAEGELLGGEDGVEGVKNCAK